MHPHSPRAGRHDREGDFAARQLDHARQPLHQGPVRLAIRATGRQSSDVSRRRLRRRPPPSSRAHDAGAAQTIVNPGSRWIPTIPRDPAERLRLLSFWFLLIAGFIEIFALLASRLTPAPLRVVAVIADVALIGWFALGHRRGKLPEFSAPFEATLLVFIGGASSLPLRSMGMFLAAVQMRGLYVTRRDYWLLPASYTVARVLAMMLTVKPAPYGPFSSTVAIQGLGMVIVSATMFLLITAIDRGAIKERELERSEERYRVLAAATHDMVYDWNVATDTVEYTDAIRTVFGFSEADLLRDRFWWLSRIHPGDRGAYDAAIATLFSSEE